MDLLVILVDSPRIGAPISRWKGRLFVELHYRTVLHQWILIAGIPYYIMGALPRSIDSSLGIDPCVATSSC